MKNENSLEDCRWRFGHAESLRKKELRLYNDDQKGHCMQVRWNIFDHLQIEPDLLHNLITGDEIWILEYDPQSVSVHSGKSLMLVRSKKARKIKN